MERSICVVNLSGTSQCFKTSEKPLQQHNIWGGYGFLCIDEVEGE